MSETTWIALGFMGLLAVISITAILRYEADKAMPVLSWVGALMGTTLGIITTYYFKQSEIAAKGAQVAVLQQAQDKLESTNEALQTQLTSAESRQDALGEMLAHSAVTLEKMDARLAHASEKDQAMAEVLLKSIGKFSALDFPRGAHLPDRTAVTSWREYNLHPTSKPTSMPSNDIPAASAP